MRKIIFTNTGTNVPQQIHTITYITNKSKPVAIFFDFYVINTPLFYGLVEFANRISVGLKVTKEITREGNTIFGTIYVLFDGECSISDMLNETASVSSISDISMFQSLFYNN